MPAKTHGHSVNHMSSPTYKKWSDMKQRCLNPLNSNFKNYGEKGIIVCERWLTFENFLSDMGESSKGLTLDRIDSNGDYSAENCRWISWIENNRNKSRVRLNSSQVSQVKLALQEFGMPKRGKNVCGIIGRKFGASRLMLETEPEPLPPVVRPWLETKKTDVEHDLDTDPEWPQLDEYNMRSNVPPFRYVILFVLVIVAIIKLWVLPLWDTQMDDFFRQQ